MARLLVVTDNPFHRTAEGVFDQGCLDRAFFDDYAAAFDQVRVAARVLTARPAGALNRADGSGFGFVDLVAARGPRWVLAPWWRYCRPLAAAIDWADAVCVRLPAVSGWHAARLARKRDKPVMFELIGDPLAAGRGSGLQRLGGLVQARRTRWITRHACVGSYVSRAHLQRRYPAAPGVPTASISSIRLPQAAFRPPRRAPAQPGRLRLILVAAMLPVKNHLTLLDALARARRQGLDLQLTLVGDGPLRPALEARIAALGLGDRVRLTGQLAARARVETELDRADLFVMPSWSEGMPRAAIEAMARGLPALGSAVGGLRELLPDAQLFEPGDADGMVALVREFLDPTRYARAATLCRQTAQAFVADALSRRRRALYRHLRLIAATRQAGSQARRGASAPLTIDRMPIRG
jgi:glycosyltransferase involved in cell wall biosynthesis